MAKEKNWNDRWGTDSKTKHKGSARSPRRYAQYVTDFTHLADIDGRDLCVSVPIALIKKLLTYRALTIHKVKLNKMVTVCSSKLGKYPLTRGKLPNQSWVSARHINKDVWEFYLE